MKKFYLNYTFAFLLSLCFIGANAQVTIGSGTNEAQNVPIEAYYGYTYSQSIYLQSEIIASGNITTLSWYFSGTSTLTNSQDIVIWMGHTTKTDFAGVADFVDTTMMTRVYTGALGTPAGPGWITVTLDNAFNYNNTDNLVIAVDENTLSYDAFDDDFHCSSVASNRSVYYYEDTNNPDPGMPSAQFEGTSAFVPNVILGGIQQSCPSPTALNISNLTSTSADLGWTENGTATVWNVEYDTAGFSQGNGTLVTGTTTNPLSVSNLMPNTTYEFYVQADCGGGSTSLWAGPFSFYTGYCIPAPTSVDGDGITNVTMGGVNNTTAAETGNYGDYSAQVATGAQGGILPIDISLNTGFGYTYDLWAWVDWNNDLDFDDAGEEFFLGTAPAVSITTFSSSITIPATAMTGNYRIRIAGADVGLGTTSPSDPCYTGSYAAFEDYTLNVISIPADDAGITALVTGNCSSAEAVVVNVGNFGANTVTSVDVSYSVNGGTAVTETWTGSIATSEDSAYVFAATFDASVPGTYEIKAWTSLPNDLVAVNDTVTIMVTSDTIYTTTFSQNFEGTPLTTGWATDAGSGLSNGHGAASVVFTDNLYSGDQAFTLISPKISGIVAGDELRFSYRYVDFSSPFPATTLGAGDTLNVLVSTDCGDNFTLIDQIHAGNHTSTTMMTALNYDLSAFAGSTIRFAILATWGTGDYWIDVDNFYVGESLMSNTGTVTNVSCFGEMDGEATAAATGGTAPYTYMWSNGTTTATASGLGAGTYAYTVMDTMGFSVSDTVVITEPAVLAVSMSAVSDTNAQAVGSATATVTGGTMPYTYTWNGTTGTSDLTAIVAGTYVVDITDANGCTVTDSIVVEDAVSTNRIDYLTDLSIYPNPTRGNTVIDLELSQNADVAISIFTVTGILVQDFAKENTSQVTHQIDLSTYAEGMYLVRFVIDNQVITKKLLVTK